MPSSKTRLTGTDSEVYSQLSANFMLSWKLFLTYPALVFPSELLQYLLLVCTRLERGEETFPWCQPLYKVLFDLHDLPVG